MQYANKQTGKGYASGQCCLAALSTPWLAQACCGMAVTRAAQALNGFFGHMYGHSDSRLARLRFASP